jgi:hypothetical protein
MNNRGGATMHILGIIGYIILCLLAAIWLLGVRTQLGCGIHVILSSLFFVVCAVALPLSSLQLIHAWWMIPSGYAVAFISTQCFKVPIIWPLLRFTGSLYAGIVRIGIDPARIKAAQAATTWAAIEEWSKHEQVSQGVAE